MLKLEERNGFKFIAGDFRKEFDFTCGCKKYFSTKTSALPNYLFFFAPHFSWLKNFYTISLLSWKILCFSHFLSPKKIFEAKLPQPSLELYIYVYFSIFEDICQTVYLINPLNTLGATSSVDIFCTCSSPELRIKSLRFPELQKSGTYILELGLYPLW